MSSQATKIDNNPETPQDHTLKTAISMDDALLKNTITHSDEDFLVPLSTMIACSVHLGHDASSWNPAMEPYIYGKTKDGIHVIDLRKTQEDFKNALIFLRDTVAKGGRVLFVGRKPHVRDMIAEMAERCGQFYVNSRWLGGLLTNWSTVLRSIEKYNQVEDELEVLQEAEQNVENAPLIKGHKKMVSQKKKKIAQYQKFLQGVRHMGTLPDVVVLFSAQQQCDRVAIAEAKSCGIPNIAILDTDSNPKDCTHIVGANDDSIKALALYCQYFEKAVIAGLEIEQELQKKNEVKEEKSAE